MSENGEENDLAHILEAKHHHTEEEFQTTMKEALSQMKEESEVHAEEIAKLKEKQVVRLQKRQEEMERLEQMRKEEEQKRKEFEAEKRKIKEEEKEKKRLEKERIKKEKEERAKKKGKKNFKIQKSETSSLAKYESTQQTEDMSKTKEQLDEEKRHALSQRIVPLDLNGLNSDKLIAKARELHDKLYQLESDKYDLEDRFKRQQYDMMELAERARQMNKGGKAGSSVKVQDEPTGPCPFDGLADKFPNIPPRVVVASKYERNLDRRNFFEKMGAFEKEWIGGDDDTDSNHMMDEP